MPCIHIWSHSSTWPNHFYALLFEADTHGHCGSGERSSNRSILWSRSCSCRMRCSSASPSCKWNSTPSTGTEFLSIFLSLCPTVCRCGLSMTSGSHWWSVHPRYSLRASDYFLSRFDQYTVAKSRRWPWGQSWWHSYSPYYLVNWYEFAWIFPLSMGQWQGLGSSPLCSLESILLWSCDHGCLWPHGGLSFPMPIFRVGRG